MAQTELSDELIDAEGLLLQNEDEQAYDLLARLAEDAEEYVDRNYQTTDEVQWFSFPTLFDRLAYRRVEKDPESCAMLESRLSACMPTLRFLAYGRADMRKRQMLSSRPFAGIP